MKAMLQCKRKAFPGQTEAERWKQIYKILFPDDEEVPDPCRSHSTPPSSFVEQYNIWSMIAHGSIDMVITLYRL